MTLPSQASAPPPGKITKPDIQPPATPPTDLLIKDLVEGSGPVAKRGDTVITEYFGIGEGKEEVYSSWDQSTPLQFKFELGTNKYFPGLDMGVEGMKPGGRRELLIPASLTDTPGPLFYVIDLLEINRKGRCWATQPTSQADYSLRCLKRTRVR